jgi:hypothetical protein
VERLFCLFFIDFVFFFSFSFLNNNKFINPGVENKLEKKTGVWLLPLAPQHQRHPEICVMTRITSVK